MTRVRPLTICQTAADSALVDALRAHDETLKTDVHKLEAQLAAEPPRADKAIAAITHLTRGHGPPGVGVDR